MRPIQLFAVPVVWAMSVVSLSAQSPKPTELLPASTIFYAEGIDSPTILRLPFVQNIVESSLFRQLWKTPDAMKLRGGMTLAEVALGEKLDVAVGKLTSQGWSIAIDGQSKGVVLWAHTADAATSNGLYRKLLAIAENDAKSKGHELKHVQYREVDAYETNGTILACVEDYLLVTNKSDLAKSLVDRWREPPAKADTLAGNQRFQSFIAEKQPAKNASSTRLVRAWLDLQQMHDLGLAKKLFEGPNDDFGAELLLGGAIAILRGAPTLEASLDAADKQLQLQLTAPLAKSTAADRYTYFFGPDGNGQAPDPIRLGGTQANVCLYRDVAQLWQRAGDLFGQKTNDQLAQAETTLTTLFSGRDFVNDILASIRPELQLIVTEQDYAKIGSPVPQVKLPAFALVTRLRDPQVMQPQMKRIFMSLIGFANVAGAMNQQPQLDLESARLESGWEVSATYAVEADRPKDWIVPIQYNFSPTLLMTGDYAVVASTKALAQSIGEQLKAPASVAPASTVTANNQARLNTMFHLDGELISRALAANRQQLISQNMLEKGHTQEEAIAEIDLVLQAVRLIKSIQIDFGAGQHATLDFQVNM